MSSILVEDLGERCDLPACPWSQSPNRDQSGSASVRYPANLGLCTGSRSTTLRIGAVP